MPQLKTKIKEYRAKFNLTQKELADLVNVRRETIVHIENGKYNPSLKLAMDIAKELDTTIEKLFTFIWVIWIYFYLLPYKYYYMMLIIYLDFHHLPPKLSRNP